MIVEKPNYSDQSHLTPPKRGKNGAIGFGFASLWLKNWRESFKPITFASHLKTALMTVCHRQHLLASALQSVWKGT